MAWQLSKITQSKDPMAYGGGGEHPLMIGLPHNGFYSHNFVKGFRSLSSPVPTIDFYITGHALDLSRNIIVSRMLQLHCDYLFFLDSDIILEPDTLRMLMELRMPILSAVYMARSPPYQPVALNFGKPLDHSITSLDPPQSIEVEQIGMGCCLIERRVFERIAKDKNFRYKCLIDHSDQGNKVMKYTNLEARLNNYSCTSCKGLVVGEFFKTTLGTDDQDPLSEDYYFCKMARKAGYRIFVLSNCVVGHEPRQGDFIITKNGLESNIKNASII